MGATVRRIVGWICVVLAALLLVLFVLGSWNPSDHVVFWRYGRNPLVGAILVSVLAFVGLWLLVPITNQAAQAGRVRLRVVTGLLALASLIGYGLFGDRFVPGYVTMATSADGERTVVMYEPDTDFQRLHVWAGTGLGEKYVGEIGVACGKVSVRFTNRDTVLVLTPYGDFTIALDPGTGRPLSKRGPRCS